MEPESLNTYHVPSLVEKQANSRQLYNGSAWGYTSVVLMHLGRNV